MFRTTIGGVIVGQSTYVVLVGSLKAGTAPPAGAGDPSTQALWDWIPEEVARLDGKLVSQSRTDGTYEWVVTVTLESSAVPSFTKFLEAETVGAPVIMSVLPEPVTLVPRPGAVPRTGPGS
jgi:hypothetical protein